MRPSGNPRCSYGISDSVRQERSMTTATDDGREANENEWKLPSPSHMLQHLAIHVMFLLLLLLYFVTGCCVSGGDGGGVYVGGGGGGNQYNNNMCGSLDVVADGAVSPGIHRRYTIAPSAHACVHQPRNLFERSSRRRNIVMHIAFVSTARQPNPSII